MMDAHTRDSVRPKEGENANETEEMEPHDDKHNKPWILFASEWP
jgi:hypothetical protein